jgi:AraC-like DNA-binding protein
MKWFEYLLFSGVVQGIFLSIVLSRVSRSNKEANRVLSVLLLLVSVILFSRIGLPKINYKISSHLWGYPDSLAFLFGPLYYLYFKRLLFAEKVKKHFFLHYIPALIHFLWVSSRNLRLSSEEIITLIQSGKLFPIWVLVTFSLTFSYLIYWIFSVSLIFRFKKYEVNVNSSRVPFVFSLVILAGILAGILTWFFWVIHFLFGIKILVFTDSDAGWIIIPLLTYFIGYHAIVQSQVFKLSPGGQKGLPRVNDATSHKILNDLKKIMQEEKPYLKPELTLSQLASMIQTSSNNLSWIINTNYKCNFYDYINQYRVSAFIEKLRQGEHKLQTLEGIAYDSGFNSKTTFNKVFTKIMNDSPGNYVKHLNSAGQPVEDMQV